MKFTTIAVFYAVSAFSLAIATSTETAAPLGDDCNTTASSTTVNYCPICSCNPPPNCIRRQTPISPSRPLAALMNPNGILTIFAFVLFLIPPANLGIIKTRQPVIGPATPLPFCPMCSCEQPKNCIPVKSAIRCMLHCPELVEI